jgi:DNA-binding transcriptional LysR family regulator
VGIVSTVTGDLFPLEFVVDGERRQIALPATVTVTGGETAVALTRLGLGIIQSPRYHVGADLAAGRLVEILPDFPPSPTPVSLLYPHNRQLSLRVRVFIDWLAKEFEHRLPA